MTLLPAAAAVLRSRAIPAQFGGNDKTGDGPMNAKINDAVQGALDQLVRGGQEIGVQVAAWLGEEQIVDAWSGLADPATGRKVDGDTLFNVYSVSKAVTATALHIQVERGLVDYDAPIATYWPEFAQAGKSGVTVAHVLAHESGVQRMPADVTPELMTNWDWMCSRLAEEPCEFPPGSRSSYQSMTFGWMVGEVVRRTDPKRRPFGQFVRQEIAEPLGAADLWLGIPASAEPRIAKLDASAVTVRADAGLRATIPIAVDLMPGPFERPYVRRACIPAVGGIFSARSVGRFWAMLANGGTLGGVRLLSAERVASFSIRRSHFEDLDPVFGGAMQPVGGAGFWLCGPDGVTAAPRNPRAICHPGMGGSMAWADPDRKLAVALCHNRMSDPPMDAPDSATIVGDVIRAFL
jgi:CubicO group peptidase (beta-lactamase class C family)